MRVDRRSLLIRTLSGVAYGFSGRWRGLMAAASATASQAEAATTPEVADLHQETRNGLLGPVGPRGRAISGPTRRYKPYTGLARRPLPMETPPTPETLADVVRSWQPHDLESASLALPLLSQLLRSTNGVTGRASELLLRAAPSAGALYAGEVYVVSLQIGALPQGAWYYDLRQHALVELQREALGDRIGTALERPGVLEGAAAVILLSNVFARYRRRYANRGYRYGLIDSGHIGENLRLATAAAGWTSVDIVDFQDDLLNELLGLDGSREAICAVHVLGRPATTSSESPSVRRLVEKRHGAGKSDIVRAWHEATKLELNEQAPARMRPQPAMRPQPRTTVALPSGEATPRMPLSTSIRERRSAVEFLREPILLTHLSFALEMAHGNPALIRCHGVDLHVVAHRVAGIEPGHYRYDPLTHRLDVVEERELEGPMVRACLGQAKAGDAAVGCVMVAQLGDAGALAHTRSYRDLLLEAGAMGERIYLAAESTGVTARNLAAYRDGAFNSLLKLDGRSEAAIHLTMLGPGS